MADQAGARAAASREDHLAAEHDQESQCDVARDRAAELAAPDSRPASLGDHHHMVHRPLGQTGLMLSPIGFGSFKIGRNEGAKYAQPYALPSEAESNAL